MSLSTSELRGKLLSFINEQTSKDEFSGTILVMYKNQVLLEYSSGYANKEEVIENSIDTLFNIGSINKIFTAVAIGQLVQQKKLSFDDTIGKFIEDCPKEIASEMTVHHILTHQEGFPSYFNKKYLEKRLSLRTVSDYLSLFINEPLLFEPGTKYQYSNSGYVVLGAIIESITEQSYYNYVKEHLYTLCNMSHTDAYNSTISIPNLAIGYTLRLPYKQEKTETVRRRNNLELPLKASPAGGGYSTVHDLYNFSKNLLENLLLNSKMTKLLLTPKVEIGSKNNETLYYGYGFQILKHGTFTRYGHAGTMAGANARLDMYPDLGYTVVVLSNYDEPAAFRIANAAGKLILDG